MERFGASWIRRRGGGPIERALEAGGEGVDDRLGRPRHAGRRHQAGAKLDDRLFPGRRGGGDIGEIERLEHEARGLEPLVVARHAVGVEERLAG